MITDKVSRHNQVIQTEWSLCQQVFSFLFSSWDLPQLDLFATRFNHKLPRFVSPDLTAWAVDALSIPWGNLDDYAFPPVSLLNQVVSKVMDQGCRRMVLIAPGWPNMPWFWDLVNLSVQIPFQLPLHKDLVSQPVNGLLHRNLTNLTCVVPRASAIQEQGFADEVAARIEAPQRSSTRAVYKSKWAIFIKWCDSCKVDFQLPSVNQIADFLLYLFKERKLQPSTIDGYRTAIADMVGNHEVNISKDENLTRLLHSFHRDKPKGRWGVPSWNLSLVLHQLTKAPFEPMRKASLKHLTFKTVFLLALGSGKRRSEIDAWVFKNIRHQENWSQVSLYPSPMFISKNQLAREGPASVAPVVIPALAPSLDRDLKEDRSLCSVRALRYYLDRTKDLRKGKELVFVSFRKSFQKDIVPATISLWIKQTVLLCYQLSDEDAQSCFKSRPMMSGLLRLPRLFKEGCPWNSLSACHWKGGGGGGGGGGVFFLWTGLFNHYWNHPMLSRVLRNSPFSWATLLPLGSDSPSLH